MIPMPTTIPPDAVQLLSEFLRDCEGVVDIVGDKIGTRTPDTVSEDSGSQWIRLSRIGGTQTVPSWLDRALIQVDCFSFQGDFFAMTLARIARAYIKDKSAGWTSAEGIITGADEEPGGLQNLPDTSRTPPTPRVTFTVGLSVRPV